MYQLIIKFKALYKVSRTSEDYPSDKAIESAIRRWMKRERISLRRITSKSQNTVYEENVMNDFVEFVNMLISMYDIPDANIVNIDETNVPFSVDSSTTYAETNSKTVGAKQANTSKRATALLGVTLSGEKLRPFLIFKAQRTERGRVRKEVKEGIGYADDVDCDVQHNAWVDEEVFIDWIENVWKPFIKNKSGHFLLLMDQFKAHMTSKVLQALSELNTTVLFIPAGYTAKLQVLDVGINMPFKTYNRRQFEEYMIENMGNDSIIPTRQNVSHWVSSSWKQIKEEHIINTWRRIGINSNQTVDWNTVQGENNYDFDDIQIDNVDDNVEFIVESISDAQD